MTRSVFTVWQPNAFASNVLPSTNTIQFDDYLSLLLVYGIQYTYMSFTPQAYTWGVVLNLQRRLNVSVCLCNAIILNPSTFIVNPNMPCRPSKSSV